MDVNESLSIAVWNAWLDGDSVNRMARVDEIASRATIERILASDPPESVRADLRYVHEGRFFWISADGLTHPQTGVVQPFVVAKEPRVITGPAFVKALRAIRREVRSLGADLNLRVLEAEDAEVLIRRVTEHGYLGFQFDANGAVTRFDPSALSSDLEPEALGGP